MPNSEETRYRMRANGVAVRDERGRYLKFAARLVADAALSGL
jgi:hypothetical protein